MQLVLSGGDVRYVGHFWAGCFSTSPLGWVIECFFCVKDVVFL